MCKIELYKSLYSINYDSSIKRLMVSSTKLGLIFFAHFLSVSSIDVVIIPEYLWGGHRARVAECDIPCEFSEKTENHDAEFYVAINDGTVQEFVNRKSEHPIKIIASQEGQHYYDTLRIEYLKQHFEATSLMNRNSDIPFVWMPNMDMAKAAKVPKHAQSKAIFVALNCYPKNDRNNYVKAIAEVIGVDAPGNCLNNMEWPLCKGRPCTKVELLRNYKIYLAFENGDSPGYVTEKIYDAFEAAILPVYMGTYDIAESVPRGSYIHVSDFKTAQDVANYLKKVVENETLYRSYFEWKYKPFDAEFDERNRVLWEDDHFCRVCYYVDAMKRGVGWDHIHQRAVDRIPPFKEFNETSGPNEIDNVKQLDGTISYYVHDNYPANSSFYFIFLLTTVIAVFYLWKIFGK